jgi:hypothetical protein
MEVGKPQSVGVNSRLKWNETGIRLTAGERYHFHATGTWVDWTITCDADGYESSNLILRVSEPLRRVPDKRWFALIGSTGKKDGEVFLIGTDSLYTPRTTGELLCFANDVILAYCNNHGAVTLTVTRVD